MKNLIIALAITAIALIQIPQTSTAQCNIDDWTALKALYESTDGDNWTENSGWDAQIANQSNPPPDCNLANLFGIRLNDEGRVSDIDFDESFDCIRNYLSMGNSLNGTIPPELGQLSRLKYLLLTI